MPILKVRRLGPGYTEYTVTSDARSCGFLAFSVFVSLSVVSFPKQLG